MGCTCFVITLGPLSVWRLSADLSPSLCPVVGLVTAFRAVGLWAHKCYLPPLQKGPTWIFPSYGYPLIYWAFVQVGSWCWATRWYYIFPTESPVNIWWLYLVVCSVSVYWLWICVISANCRHRPLATDPGHAMHCIYCKYGETEAVMCVMIVVTCVCGTWSSIWILDRSA